MTVRIEKSKSIWTVILSRIEKNTHRISLNFLSVTISPSQNFL